MNRDHLATNRIEELIRLACVLEVTARKPGNVHPEASFEDLAYADFLQSAEVIAPVLARSGELGVGRAILAAVERTREATPANSNLGIVLLLGPLAAVPEDVSLAEGIGSVLAGLTREDAVPVYRAIRLADPGGMGEVAEADLSQKPAVTLLEAMRLAAERDTIALQYASGFDLVLNVGVPLLGQAGDFEHRWEEGVIRLHLQLMARRPDTLIARKCGAATAELAAQKAQGVLDAGWPAAREGRRLFEEFDGWLRADGHRRNPGTTADLVAAVLFAALREKVIDLPQGVE